MCKAIVRRPHCRGTSELREDEPAAAYDPPGLLILSVVCAPLGENCWSVEKVTYLFWKAGLQTDRKFLGWRSSPREIR